MRAGGTVQMAAAPSTSSHRAPRTSPERQAVSTRNSKASAVARWARDARTRARASPTRACGSAFWCRRGTPFFGSAAEIAAPRWRIARAIVSRAQPRICGPLSRRVEQHIPVRERHGSRVIVVAAPTREPTFSGDRSIASRHASRLHSRRLFRPVQANENESLVALTLDVEDVSRLGSRNDDTPLDVGSNRLHGWELPTL